LKIRAFLYATALTSVTARCIGTSRVRAAVVGILGAFVDIDTVLTSFYVTRQAIAGIASLKIRAFLYATAVVGSKRAFIDIGADNAVSAKTVVTVTDKATRGVFTGRIGIARLARALIDIAAVDAVARVSCEARTLKSPQ